MRSYLAIFLFATFALAINAGELTSEDMLHFQETLGKCYRNHKVSPTIMKQLMSGETVKNRKFDCFMACMMQGVGVASAEGYLDVEAAIEKIPDFLPNREILIDVLRGCGYEKGEDKCATAHKIYECMMDRNIHSIFMG